MKPSPKNLKTARQAQFSDLSRDELTNIFSFLTLTELSGHSGVCTQFEQCIRIGCSHRWRAYCAARNVSTERHMFVVKKDLESSAKIEKLVQMTVPTVCGLYMQWSNRLISDEAPAIDTVNHQINNLLKRKWPRADGEWTEITKIEAKAMMEAGFERKFSSCGNRSGDPSDPMWRYNPLKSWAQTQWKSKEGSNKAYTIGAAQIVSAFESTFPMEFTLYCASGVCLQAEQDDDEDEEYYYERVATQGNDEAIVAVSKFKMFAFYQYFSAGCGQC